MMSFVASFIPLGEFSDFSLFARSPDYFIGFIVSMGPSVRLFGSRATLLTSLVS